MFYFERIEIRAHAHTPPMTLLRHRAWNSSTRAHPTRPQSRIALGGKAVFYFERIKIRVYEHRASTGEGQYNTLGPLCCHAGGPTCN